MPVKRTRLVKPMLGEQLPGRKVIRLALDAQTLNEKRRQPGSGLSLRLQRLPDLGQTRLNLRDVRAQEQRPNGCREQKKNEQRNQPKKPNHSAPKLPR